MDQEMELARRLVIETLEARAPYLQPWAFERTPASSQSVPDAYLSKVREARFLFWLVGSKTTDPVEAEVREAMGADVAALVFLLPAESRDKQTEALLGEFGDCFKYRKVRAVEDLPIEVDRALSDEVARALRTSTARPAQDLLELLGRSSRARCVERWLAAGLPAKTATELADQVDVGAAAPEVLPDDSRPFLILTGEAGLGKSLASERFLQTAIASFLTDNQAPIPIFLRAGEVGDSLEAAASKVAAGLGDPRQLGACLVVDGVDEVGLAKADQLLNESRALVRTWPRTQLLMTSRPMSPSAEEEETCNLPRLEEEQSRELAGLAAGREVTLGDQSSWAEPVREAARVPLFALLLGLALHDGSPGRSRAQLLGQLADRAVSTVGPEARPLLRRFAVLATERANSPIDESELGGPGVAAELENTRLIARDEGQLRFPLVLVAQWFAAEALAEGEKTAAELVAAPADLDLWRYPLTLLAANFSDEQVMAVIGPLARAHPGFASQVIQESIGRWSDDLEGSIGPLAEAGRRIREVTAAWLTGLGELGLRLLPLARREGEEIKLPPLGVAVHGSHLIAGWYAGGDDLGEIETLPPAAIESPPRDGAAARNWPHLRGARPSKQAGWAWRWGLEELGDEIEFLIRNRSISVDSAAQATRVWRASLIALGLGHGHREPLEIDAVRTRARELWQGDPTTYVGTGGQVSVGGLLEALDAAAERGQTTLTPPPERAGGSSLLLPPNVRQELGLERLAELYQQAMEEYEGLSSGLFASLKPFMQTAMTLPACMHAQIYPIPSDAPTSPDTGIAWWFEALPFGEPSRTDFTVEEGGREAFVFAWKGRTEELTAQTRARRPDQARWIGLSFHTSYLHLDPDSPLNEIVLSWLWQDLDRINWVSGHLGERRSQAQLLP